jgi:hypothetical protein
MSERQQYAGSDWLRQAGRITNISPLGEAVADLLGDLFYGIYHLDGAAGMDWSNNDYIEIRMMSGAWATFDPCDLTRLVFLAHDRCLRVDINPRSHRSLTLLFHQRKREGGVWARHPTLEEAVAEHRRWHSVEEVK